MEIDIETSFHLFLALALNLALNPVFNLEQEQD
jgi:hypothetical protein